MSSLKTLQHLRDIEKKKLARQEAKLGKSVVKRTTEEESLEQLKVWEQQYRANLTRIGNAPMTGTLLRDYAHFLRQLEKVIAQQKIVVTQAQEQENRERRTWKTLYDTGFRIEKVSHKRQVLAQMEDDKTEQKMQDELVMGHSSRPKYRG